MKSTGPWTAALISGTLLLGIGSVTFATASAARFDALRAADETSGLSIASPVSAPAVPIATGSPSGSTGPLTENTGNVAETATPTGTHRSSSALSSLPAGSAARPTRRPVPNPVESTTNSASTLASIPRYITLGPSDRPIRIVPIGVSSEGVLEPPADISRAGWWVAGPRPGAPGRAIITGHIDSPAGLGAFAALDLLHEGDPILVTGTDGQAHHYRVSNRQEIEKTNLDPALLSRTPNHSDLLLITCIGTFDESTRSYESNLLITAVALTSN